MLQKIVWVLLAVAHRIDMVHNNATTTQDIELRRGKRLDEPNRTGGSCCGRRSTGTRQFG